ncbi:Dihydropteroate synthase [Bathymodiolus thermophilus thioautotrophic gill symbiont]|uniref:Dihydropteroate synthase n=2 Tax=Bathymodiolus thermophilus thioautotrophic gill symbiont TaxID=2360 RepID=A0A8H9CHK1_9GAMM|nr:dihydropteroate synthase [Bathymodiolus thermophilus thioautotrophic gill symbiont]CAB5500467.1 Dihydropteroate synthase (EC [Bathymodiolus thermophilus thioautotrophic gill symbiont]SHA12407.1 Dihydropteroate synthase [Bathymodiolus thermophilus thioautotrophic gill symbiont]
MTVQTKIMGVLNVTPDSFSDGGQHFNSADAIQGAQRMIEQGVDIIDVGGESSRPNADPVSVVDEIQRVIPVIETLIKITNTPISIDTSKPEVMAQAVKAGASMINDIYALRVEGALKTASELGVNICLMHMQGSPSNMQNNPVYGDVVDDIKHFFEQRIEACVGAGIGTEKLILDPGFGFGKTYEHNLEILRRFNEFKSFGLPLLAGLSRKRMIAQMLNDRKIKGRVVGSTMAAIIAIQKGANMVRVHDVLATKDALTILQKVEK